MTNRRLSASALWAMSFWAGCSDDSGGDPTETQTASSSTSTESSTLTTSVTAGSSTTTTSSSESESESESGTSGSESSGSESGSSGSESGTSESESGTSESESGTSGSESETVGSESGSSTGDTDLDPQAPLPWVAIAGPYWNFIVGGAHFEEPFLDNFFAPYRPGGHPYDDVAPPRPVWSGTGRWLAQFSGAQLEELVFHDLQTGVHTAPVTLPASLTYVGWVADRGLLYSWSSGDEYVLGLASPDGALTELYRSAVSRTGFWSFQISGDGEHLMFYSNDDVPSGTEYTQHCFLLEVDTHDLVPLNEEDERACGPYRFSPDSRWLAMTVPDEPGPSLFLRSSAGGERVRVNPEGQGTPLGGFAFAPDAHPGLVFRTTANDEEGLSYVPLGDTVGEPRTLVTPAPQVIDLDDVSWSPTGRFFAHGIDDGVLLHDLQQTSEGAEIELPSSELPRLAWIDDESFAYSATVDGAPQIVWVNALEPGTTRPLGEMGTHIRIAGGCMAVSNEGTVRLGAASVTPQLEALEVQGLQAATATLAPNGQSLAFIVGTDGGSADLAYVQALSDCRPLGTPVAIPVDTGNLDGVAFLPTAPRG